MEVKQPALAVKKMTKMKKQAVTSKALMKIRTTTHWADRPSTCLMMTRKRTQSLMMQQQLLGSRMVSTSAESLSSAEHRHKATLQQHLQHVHIGMGSGSFCPADSVYASHLDSNLMTRVSLWYLPTHA